MGQQDKWIPEESHLFVLCVIIGDDLRSGHANFHSIHDEFASLFQGLLLALE